MTPTLRADFAASAPLPPRYAEVLETVRARTAAVAEARALPRLAATDADAPYLRRLADRVQAEVARRLRLGQRRVAVTAVAGQAAYDLPANLGTVERVTIATPDALGQVTTFDARAFDGTTFAAAALAGQVSGDGYGYGLYGGRLYLAPPLPTGTLVTVYAAGGSLLDEDGDLAALPGLEVQGLIEDGVLAAWYESRDALDLAALHRERYLVLLDEKPVPRQPPRAVRRIPRPF